MKEDHPKDSTSQVW